MAAPPTRACPNDPRVKTTLFRWGNYDVVNAAVVWNAAEVPSTLTPFGNPVPGNQTLPASLYLAGKPAWWGSVPWPAIGPDVTGGQDPTGHAYKLPARLCYDATPKTGGILNFNAAACYSTVQDTTPPTVSITSPANGAAGSGTMTIAGAASDSGGVAGVQFKLDGANLGAEATVAPYTVAWDTTGATNGSHSLTATARDAAGNTATSAAIAVTVNNVQDTTAPSIPANLAATAASTTQINLTWNASTDSVGVTGYRVFRCQGAGCSATVQVATPTATSYSDTALSPSTAYTYTVSAFDAAGNVSAKSAPASAVTLSLTSPSAGQVAAYGFNENVGQSTADASSNQNTGSVSGAGWTPGKFGARPVFQRNQQLCQRAGHRSADAADQGHLHGVGVVERRARGNGVGVQQVEPDRGRRVPVRHQSEPNVVFWLADDGRRDWGTTGYNQASGTAVVPLATMTHIAVVRSGASLKFYINGNLDVVSEQRHGRQQLPQRDRDAAHRRSGPRGAKPFLRWRDRRGAHLHRALSQAEIQAIWTRPSRSLRRRRRISGLSGESSLKFERFERSTVRKPSVTGARVEGSRPSAPLGLVS